MDVLHKHTRTAATTTPADALLQRKTPYGRPQTGDREQEKTAEYGRPQTSADVVVDLLREQLQVLREALQAARQNAQAAQEREALLLRMLHESQLRYDRLLEAPRPPVVAPDATAIAASTLPRARGFLDNTGRDRATAPTARGAMRRRIVALLQDHPAGLSPAQVRRHLGAEKSLANTILAMARDGLLQRVGHGRYVVTRSRDET